MRKIDRVKKRFIEEGLDVTLNVKKGSRIYGKKADGDFEAHLVALSCSDPPEGFSRWSMRLLADMNTLGYEKIKVVMDPGFFSAGNINDMYRYHMKFLIAAKLSLKLVKTHLNTVRDKMHSWTYYSQAYQLYTYSLPITWNYVQDRPYKGNTIKATKHQMDLYAKLGVTPPASLQ